MINIETFIKYRDKTGKGELVDLSEIKEINGLNGYFVSPKGIAISFKHKEPMILKPYVDMNGYYIYGFLSDDKKLVYRKLHRLLAEAFIPNPNGFPFVLHYDDNKNNNSLNNLRWGTHEENMEDKKRNEKCIVSPVYCLEFDKYYKSAQEAANDVGVDRTSIIAVCKGKNNSVHGLHFCYTKDKEKYDKDPLLWPIGKNCAVKAINTVTGEERIFKNRKEAYTELGLSSSELSGILSGKRHTTHKWTFKYCIPIKMRRE